MAWLPGVPVTCTASNTAYPLTSLNIAVAAVRISQKPTNNGIGYVGDSTLAPATDVGIIAVVDAPAGEVDAPYVLLESPSLNGINLGDLRVASSGAGEKLLWSYRID